DDGSRMGCGLSKGYGCTYESARQQAKAAQAVLTNYAFWFAVNRFRSGLEWNERELAAGKEPNPFECLILDEAHLAETILANHLSVKLYEKEIKELARADTPQNGESIFLWRKWASELLPDIDLMCESGKADLSIKRKKVGYRDIHLVRK